MSKGDNIVDSVLTAITLASEVKTFPQSMMIIAGSRGSGKTRLAKTLAEKGLGTYTSLSLVLSHYLMTVNLSDDAGWMTGFVASLVSSVGSEKPLILDNIEAVFQPELQLNPLRWLLQIAREVPLVVVWPGAVSQGEFVYSTPNRPDYYHQRDTSVVVLNIDP